MARHSKIIVGQKYSKWTVLEYTKTERSARWYLCRCDCGTEQEIRATYLFTGKAQGCTFCRDKETVYIGKQFGRLTILDDKPITDSHKYTEKKRTYLCQCDCGNILHVLRGNLLRGKSTQCRKCSYKSIGVKNTKHGYVNFTSFRSWYDMIYRCYNQKAKSYHNYGGRGIIVCKRWYCFENFYKDMGDRPPGYSIERIDVNGHYTPENCCWIPKQDQAKNTRRTLNNR